MAAKRVYLLLIIGLFTLVSCMKEELPDDSAVVKKYNYSIKGIATPESKVSVGDKVSGKWPLLWEQGDEVGVYRADGSFVGVATLDEEYYGQNVGKFTLASNVSLVNGESLSFIYPYDESIAYSKGNYQCKLNAVQTVRNVTSSSGLGDNIIGYATSNYSVEGTAFSLSYVNACVRFSFSTSEFKGYSLHGLTLWADGTSISGSVMLNVSNGAISVSESTDHINVELEQPMILDDDTYEIWVSALPEEFSGKNLYAIFHLSSNTETVTLPILLKGATSLKRHSVTDISLPVLTKSLVPEWYEPVESRYISADGMGWSYGAENTILFTQNGETRTVEFKARGNFMKTRKPVYVKAAYATDLSDTRNSGLLYINGEDAYSSGGYGTFTLDENTSASIQMKAWYKNSTTITDYIGHIAGLYVMDKDENVIWGTNLWLALRPFVTTQFTNGKVLNRNLGADIAPCDVSHWTTNGCYFQWGRPWAFPWTANITNNNKIQVSESSSLESSASNPYTFIYNVGEPCDWYYGDGSSVDRTGDLDDLWGNPNGSSSTHVTTSGLKSIYDPCPEGYKVVSPSVMFEIGNDLSSKVYTSTSPNYILHNNVSFGLSGGYLGSVSSGNLSRSNGNNNTTFLAAYWTNSNVNGKGSAFVYQPTSSFSVGSDGVKTAAYSVRCMVDEGGSIDVGGSGGSDGGGDTGNGGNLGGGGEIDNEEVQPEIPEDFEEEADDPSADLSMTFDYAKLTTAGHPRLLVDTKGFNELKTKVTTDRASNLTLYKLHNEVLRRAKKIVDSNRQFSTASDYSVIAENLLSCSYAYRLSGTDSYLTKAKSDLAAVCNLSDWNPSGLAVGEIALAVAIAYDWLYYDLTLEERTLAHKAMVNKAITPMYNKSYATTIGNWNSICLGGVACASLAVYEKDKGIAVKQIEKAVKENLVAVKGMYYPDGNYAEGLGYWEYGSTFQAIFLSCLDCVFGHTAGIEDVAGFLNSGEYALFMHGTNETSFSYNDGGSSSDPILLSSWWFAARNDNPQIAYCERRRVNNGDYTNTDIEATVYRHLAPIVVSIRNLDLESESLTPPTKEIWYGRGEMPVGVVRKGWNFDGTDVYLGVKAGHCNTWKTSETAHAHMDAGSFVFEAEGVRWADDIPRPAYGAWNAALSAAGSRSGDTSQSGLKWDTFRISNLCHSAIVSYTNDGSVTGKLHSTDYYVDGAATIDKIIDSEGRQGFVVDMTSPMKGQVKSSVRTIELVNGTDLVVTDKITAIDNLDCSLEWRMLSMSSCSISDTGVTLSSNGNKRILEVSTDNVSITPVYMVWPTTKPITDGWGVLDFDQEISGRIIAGWKATVPKGKTITFTTTLKRL